MKAQKTQSELGQESPVIPHTTSTGVARRPAADAVWVNNVTLNTKDNEKNN